MSDTIELPDYGLTLLPPWWAYVLWGDKRWENRAPAVANRIGYWRGNVLLTASKQPDGNDWEGTIETSYDVRASRKKRGLGSPWIGEPPTLGAVKELSGKAVCVAELIDVRAYDPREPWAVEGQVGLVVGRVWEIGPIPAQGGVGFWSVEWCRWCHRVIAENARKGDKCADCGRTAWLQSGEEVPRPMLTVIRECTI